MKFLNKPIFSLFLAHMVTDLYMPVTAAIIPLLISTRGYSYFLAGLLVTAYNLTSSTTQPFFGWLSDRHGKQVHISVSILISAVFIGIMGVLEQYPLMLACAAIAALGHSCFHPHALSMVSRLATNLNRGKVTALFVVGGNIGYAIGPILAGAVVVSFGLKGLPLLVIPALIMAFALRNIVPRLSMSAHNHIAPHPGRPKISTFTPVFFLFAASTIRAWAVFAAIAFFPPFLIQRGLDIFSANFLITLMLLSGVAGQVIGGAMADMYGKKEFVLLGMCVSIPMFLIFFASSGPLSLIALLLFGFSLWSSFALTVAIAHELMPAHVGMTSGLMLGVAVGAGGLGVAFTGFIADSYSLGFALASIPLLVAGSIILMVMVPYPWKSIWSGHGSQVS